jgi:hypothetical protein
VHHEDTIDIPVVSACEVTECAITVGNGIYPGCDTCFSDISHTRHTSHVTGVNARKLINCRYNDYFLNVVHKA